MTSKFASKLVCFSILVVAGVVGQSNVAGAGQTLKVGVTMDIPGMNYQDPTTGAIGGFEPNLAKAIARQLPGGPDDVEFVQVSDSERITSLQDGLVDMVIAQLTVTPERAAKVDFTIPYYFTKEGLLVPKGSSIKGFEDLKGKRIAVTAASASLQNLRAELPSLAGASLVVSPTTKDTFETVVKDGADAAISDYINLTLWPRASGKSDQYELIDLSSTFAPKPWAVAVAKGNSPLLGRLNNAIEGLKSNGEIDKLLNQAVANIGH